VASTKINVTVSNFGTCYNPEEYSCGYEAVPNSWVLCPLNTTSCFSTTYVVYLFCLVCYFVMFHLLFVDYSDDEHLINSFITAALVHVVRPTQFVDILFHSFFISCY
jgi:hypothetical protein